MSTIYLPTPIYIALEAKGLNNFSVVECLKAGYGNENTSYTNAAGYSYIYLQILKLVDKGLLSKKSNGRNMTFIKTREYCDATIAVCISQEDETSPLKRDALPQLNKRYDHYENQIQSLWGEQGEYDELANLYPQFEEVIGVASNQVYEKINSTLGKLRAVKVIIEALAENKTYNLK